jgi:formylglycine-generating enzyme required for sulfatase activity
MARWFLSYHSLDQSLAERLKNAIVSKDPGSSVFFAPTSLRAGGAWTAQLAAEIGAADAFILLIADHDVGKWQVPEYFEALDRWVKSQAPFPLVVVLLEGKTAPGLPFLRQLHWIVTPDPASDKAVAAIVGAASGAGGRPAELWRYAQPYRGLEAMEEKDSDYFFGRTRETVEALDALAAKGRLPVLIGNSGVGKSSLAQAGVLAALKRQAWPDKTVARPWPAVFQTSRQWAYLTLKPGAEPIKALVECFLQEWQFSATDPERVKLQLGWIELLQGKARLADLIDATERRRVELDQPKPPAFLLYIDQGEELYTRAEPRERQRFSELLGEALADPRLRAMMSMRSDFLGSLQRDEPLFQVRELIEAPPLGEDGLREVVSRPAELLGARFDNKDLVDIIARRAAEDSVKDVGALPLLSYTLDDMWTAMLKAGDGVLRLPAQSFELGGVLVDRANRFLAERPGAEDLLRRILAFRLATVWADGEPTRRRAFRDEFSDEEWRLVSELSGYPNRLLVTATTEAGETYAEVAHEAIFRRWDRLKKWISDERAFLSWRSGLETTRRAWEAMPDRDKNGGLLMGFGLAQARSWLAKRSADLPEADRTFIVASRKAEQRQNRRTLALIGAVAASILVGVVGWWNQDWLRSAFREGTYRWATANVLTTEKERALKPGDVFRECRDCPEMVVAPAGKLTMGSPEDRGAEDEHPAHEVAIAGPFAVAKFELTFDEWDACAAHGDCTPHVGDNGWGRGRRPVVNVSWDDAETYVNWLSRITGKPYRLLTEAEYEYAARAGTETRFPWGDEFMLDGQTMTNCPGCGGSSQTTGETAPVGSFPANAFGLYDMTGNVRAWTEDCWHDDYEGAPEDGSAWADDNCYVRVVRSGSFREKRLLHRSAYRDRRSSSTRFSYLGFRVARTLNP